MDGEVVGVSVVSAPSVVVSVVSVVGASVVSGASVVTGASVVISVVTSVTGGFTSFAHAEKAAPQRMAARTAETKRNEFFISITPVALSSLEYFFGKTYQLSYTESQE